MRIALGLALLAGAVTAGLVAARNRRLWSVLRRTAVTTPDQLADAARTGRLDRRLHAVVGTAGPGRGGGLVSTVNLEPCVWHRHTIRHRQVRYRTDGNGRTRRSTSRRRAGDVASRDPFTLAGTSGRIEVQPDAMRVHRPERRGTRILPGIASQPFPEELELATAGAVQNSYRHKEWIIRAGTPLYVLGEVATRRADGRSAVVLRRPAKGPHVISTRGARQLYGQARLVTVAALAVALIAAVTGVIVLV